MKNSKSSRAGIAVLAGMALVLAGAVLAVLGEHGGRPSSNSSTGYGGAGANTAETPSWGDPLNCDFSGIDSPMVTAKIDNLDIHGAELRMPRDYVISLGFRDGAVRRALLLDVFYKDFRPYTRSDEYWPDGRSKIAAGVQEGMTILISSLISMKAIAIRMVAWKYGQRETDPALDIEGVRQPNGLYLPRYESRLRYDEVFLGRQGDEITDVIMCDRIGDVPFPSCDHIFEAGAYDVEITYPRHQLDRWKTLRRNTEKLLACFTVKEPRQVHQEMEWKLEADLMRARNGNREGN